MHSRLPHLKNIIVRHVYSTSSFVKPYFQQLENHFSIIFNNLLDFLKAPCSTIESFAVIVFGEARRTSRKTSRHELFDAFDIKKHQSTLTAARRATTSLNFQQFSTISTISRARELTRTSRNPHSEPAA